MELRAQLGVITTATGITEERFACGRVSAFVAIVHGVGEKSDSLCSPFGRSQTGPSNPWRSIESRVVNQNIFSVEVLTTLRIEASLRSELAIVSTWKRLWPKRRSKSPDRAT